STRAAGRQGVCSKPAVRPNSGRTADPRAERGIANPGGERRKPARKRARRQDCRPYKCEQYAFLSKRMTKTVFPEACQLLIRKSEPVPRQLVFTGEAAAEHRRIVGIEHNWDACIEDPAQRVLRQASNRAGRDVTRNADLERNSAIPQMPQ